MNLNNNIDANSLLRDLIFINNDRIERYRKAISKVKPKKNELIEELDSSIRASHFFRNEIARDLVRRGEEVPKSSIHSGKIYQEWAEANDYTSQSKEVSILTICKKVEKAAIKAYQQVLETDNILTGEQVNYLKRQLNKLKRFHTRFKNLSNSESLFSSQTLNI